MRATLLLAIPVLCGAFACATPTRGARVQDAAQELNVNTRFGRMTLALEHVAQRERDAFTRRHKGWGGAIRIADSELAGMHFVSDHIAEVLVQIAWVRADEQELRVTTVRQRYQENDGDWSLIEETREEGEAGLFGEEREPAPPPTKKPGARFPTITLGRGE